MNARKTRRLLRDRSRAAAIAQRAPLLGQALLLAVVATAFWHWPLGERPERTQETPPRPPVVARVAEPAAPKPDPSGDRASAMPAPLALAAHALPVHGHPPAPTRDFLRGAITDLIAQHGGGRSLRSGELESLIDALERTRLAREEAAALDADPALDARRAVLNSEAERATDEAREIAGFDAPLDDLVGRFLGVRPAAR